MVRKVRNIKFNVVEDEERYIRKSKPGKSPKSLVYDKITALVNEGKTVSVQSHFYSTVYTLFKSRGLTNFTISKRGPDLWVIWKNED